MDLRLVYEILPASPVHRHHLVQGPLPQWNVGDVGTPHLAGLPRRGTAEGSTTGISTVIHRSPASAVRVEVQSLVVRGFDCGDSLELRLPAKYKLTPASSHSCPIQSKTSGWQAEGLQEPSPPCPKTISDKYRVCEGFSIHPDRLSCVQQALASPIWGEVVVPLMAAGTAARGSCPAARGTPDSTSVRAGSATIMTGHAEDPGLDSLGAAGLLVARSLQREPPSVPTSGQAGHRDHCRQAGRRPDAGHLSQHHEAGRAERGMTRPKRYTIVIEKSPKNYAAYVPDLPGCVATGASEAEAVSEIREAIRFHIESLREHHEPVPERRCTATVVDVVALAG